MPPPRQPGYPFGQRFMHVVQKAALHLPLARVRSSVRSPLAGFRLLLVAFVVMCACGTVGSPAFADEWPAARQFELVSPPPPPAYAYPPPSSIVETRDGTLFVAIHWPLEPATPGPEREYSWTRVVRIAPNGSRAYVPPFGPPGRGSVVAQIDDEILPLPDGSMLFTEYNAIQRVRSDGK